VSGWGEPRHYVLPVLALLIQPLAYIARMTRAGVLQVLGQDYVRTAYAKGLPGWRVLAGHVLPNAALSIITVVALALSYALTGALVVETIFRVPGMGQAAIGALFQRDYPMVQAVGLLYTVVFITTNLLVVVAGALVLPALLPYRYDQQNLDATFQGPSPGHPLGTDQYGRDLLARLAYGGRISLLVGGATVLAAVLVGGVLGAAAAWV